MVEVHLLKPLDGKAIGETAEYDEADVKALEALHAVRRVPVVKAAPETANKAEPAPANKAMRRAPANKGA